MQEAFKEREWEEEKKRTKLLNNEQETRGRRDCKAAIIVSPSGALIWDDLPGL